MPHAMDAVLREELRRAGLASHGPLSRLLAVLRAAPDTHLTVFEVANMAAEAGLATTQAELTRSLEALADHGLLGRLPTTTGELVFDTIPEPHAHMFYDEAGQIVDLHVSADTLLTMLRNALEEHSGHVEVLVRFRRARPPAV